MEKIRKPSFILVYEGVDISQNINDLVISITYTDNLTGTADEVSIELDNRDFRFWKDWQPRKKDKLELYIGYDYGRFLNCGKFTVDEPNHSLVPRKTTIRATSFNSPDIRLTNKNRVFENTTLSRIVNQIALENGLQPFIKLENDIKIKREEQKNISDSKFLNDLSIKYGCILKLTDEKLVFMSYKTNEDLPPALTINYNDIVGGNIRDTAHDLFKKCTVEYFDKEDNKVKKYTFEDSRIESGEHLKIVEKAHSIEQAKEMAKGYLRNKNMRGFSISLDLIGNPSLVSGLTVNLSGFYNYDGKYLINKAIHKISSSGYITSLELMRCWNY